MNKIVVVDDDREMGRLLKTLFELEGYQVVVVRVFEEILDTLCQVKPDLIVMDVHVQNCDTISLVSQLRDEESLANVPLIMTSGIDRGCECEQAGADLFLTKPFLPTVLLQKTQDLLKSSVTARSAP
ncbi:MAG: response regulator transcription factor [Anaerolineae bacterium]|nr:response regulator transcription factor [Anaerolineae bacterium]